MNKEIEIENLFKKHFFIEFVKSAFTKDGRLLFSENIEQLNEERGIIPNLDLYCSCFADYILINFDFREKGGRFFLTKNIFKNINNCFFKNIDITIEYTLGEKNDGDGIYRHGGVLDDIVDDKLFLLNIYIKINGDKYHFREILMRIFAHEITHAYENYMRLKNGEISLLDANKKDGYLNNKDWFYTKRNDSLSPIEALKRVIYFLNKSEMNAFSATLKHEMLKNIEQYNNVNNICELLKKCNVYKHYAAVKEYLEFLINVQDENIKKEILNEYNRIMNKDINSYLFFRKLLILKFEMRVEKMLNKFSKIAFDTYHEYKYGATVSPTLEEPIKKIKE